MQHNRRHFIKLALTSAVSISVGNTVKALTGSSFKLPNVNEVKLRVAIASDGHYGEPKTLFEKNHSEMVSWLNAEKAERGVDFAFINGDLFHNDTAFAQPVKKVWDTLAMPYYVSHGNHDMMNEDAWTKTWNQAWHYGFEEKEIGFVVLNTADEKGAYISPDVNKTNKLLQQYAGYKQLFVFMHITPVNWTDGSVVHAAVVDLLSAQPNLKAVFHGHDHDLDDVKERRNRYYFFDSHVSGSWGTPYRGYRILEVLKNGDVLTYQMNPQTSEKINSRQL